MLILLGEVGADLVSPTCSLHAFTEAVARLPLR